MPEQNLRERVFDLLHASRPHLPERDLHGEVAPYEEHAVDVCSKFRTGEVSVVSDQAVIVMSASSAIITDNVGGVINVVGVATIVVTVGDNKGNGTISQPMAGGTTVKATTSNGTLVGPSSYTFPCSNVNGPLSFTFSIESDSFSDSGVMTVVVETPSGLVTTHIILVND